MRYGGLIAAIVFAAIAAIAVLRMSGGESSGTPVPVAASAQEIKGIPIYVAGAAIPIGSAVTQEMVTTQQWPENLMLPGFIKADKEASGKVIGMVTRGPFQQGEPIIESKLANPKDPNFLAGELPKGMRVVTIPLNEVDGVAGFVFPGDHVDLIYTHEIEKWVTPPSAGVGVDANSAVQRQTTTVTETLLTNVKVLAVDQRPSNAGSTDSKGNLIVPKSASVMVSQSDAQRVRLAQKTGTVSLALRAIADKDSADPLVLTKNSDVSQTQAADLDSSGLSGDASVRVVRGAPKRETESTSIKSLPPATSAAATPPQQVTP